MFLQTSIEEEKKIIARELQKLNESFKNTETEKKEYSSKRIERNPRIVTLLKKIHPNRCQICSVEHFSTKNGEKYCEVHHIVELSKGGSQATDNCLVLCATCHRKLYHANVLLENNGSERIKITVNGTVFDVKRNIVSG